jgi:solute carrier family 25 protein 16
MQKIDYKGKGKADPSTLIPDTLEEHHWTPARDSERWTGSSMWRRSRERAKADKDSWDYSQSTYMPWGSGRATDTEQF